MTDEPARGGLEFHGLMPYRVHEALLLSSEYDAFILEEDGPLTDRVFSQYSELNLSQVPRITHVTTARAAMVLLDERRFDLVITVVRVEDTDADRFSAEVKAKYPRMPVVLVIFDEGDLRLFPNSQPPPTVDRVFLWTGDATILIAAIKLIEDQRNAHHDTKSSGVQVIVVVEDGLRAYSTFLGLLYRELLLQSQSLISEGVNELHRLLRMRARPKILLANCFEDGLALVREFSDHVLALVTDVRFPRDGVEDPEAGLALARIVRAELPDLPMLVQSSEADNKEAASELATFVDKRSPTFPVQVRGFLKESLGFGDFVFRLPNRSEVARARDLYEMEEVLKWVDAKSIAFHGRHNHFSIWLKARSKFDLAAQVRKADVDEFASLEAVRSYLIRVLAESRLEEQEGIITDFSPLQTGPDNRFVRLGKGSIGGKGRGIAFVNGLIAKYGLLSKFDGLEIRIPKTVVIGTDEYDLFMTDHDAGELQALPTDADVTRKFLEDTLPPALVRDLWTAFQALNGPLAVRSSSLLEDSRFLPFAGVYATFMLANDHPDPMVRFNELSRAVMAVYGSTFWRDARAYVARTPHVLDEEKMAVVIQQVVGQRHGDRFYPHASGVAQSYNFYALGGQKPSDGMAEIALGLGEMVVGGGAAVQFSPGAPGVLPQYSSASAYMRLSQSNFFAIDMSKTLVDFFAGPRAFLDLHPLAAAEEDGTLAIAGSVFDAVDDQIRDNLQHPGPRVVTFNNLLKWNAVPLAEALAMLLGMLRDAMGSEIEVEFALDMGDWGKHPARGQHRREPRLYILQVRPMAALGNREITIDLDSLPEERVVCRTHRALGEGLIDDIRDIVFVETPDPTSKEARAIATDVGTINDALVAEDRGYMLIGPGRWGTSDPDLGIPVDWCQIAGARVIVETDMGDRHVDPSQGTHFFQNVVALRIGYLTVTASQDGLLDRAWLEAQPIHRSRGEVHHVRLSAPLEVHVDGIRGAAAVLRPAED